MVIVKRLDALERSKVISFAESMGFNVIIRSRNNEIRASYALGPNNSVDVVYWCEGSSANVRYQYSGNLYATPKQLDEVILALEAAKAIGTKMGAKRRNPSNE